MMTDASAKFTLSQFLRSLLFHMLFMWFWLLAVPIMLLFVNATFLRNTGFLPSKGSIMFFFVLQTFQALLWIIFWALFIYDRYFTDEEQPKLSAEPLGVAIVLVISRFMHMAVRHGVTPANQMLKLSDRENGDKDL